MDDLQGLETRVTYVQRAAYEPPRSMHPRSESNLTTRIFMQPVSPITELPNDAFADSPDDEFFSNVSNNTSAQSSDDEFFSTASDEEFFSLRQPPLPPKLNEYNIPIGVRRPIKGDGNCLYASLAVAFMGDVKRKDEVRFKIANYEADLLDEYYDLSMNPEALDKRILEVADEVETLQSMIDDNDAKISLQNLKKELKSLEIIQAITVSFAIEKETKLEQLQQEHATLKMMLEESEQDEANPQQDQLYNAISQNMIEWLKIKDSKFDPNEYVRSTATESEFGKTAEILAFTVLYPATIYMYGYDGAGNLFRQHDAQFGDGPHPVHLILQGAHFEPIVNPDASIQQ
jgi:hypothetical protein